MVEAKNSPVATQDEQPSDKMKTAARSTGDPTPANLEAIARVCAKPGDRLHNCEASIIPWPDGEASQLVACIADTGEPFPEKAARVAILGSGKHLGCVGLEEPVRISDELFLHARSALEEDNLSPGGWAYASKKFEKQRLLIFFGRAYASSPNPFVLVELRDGFHVVPGPPSESFTLSQAPDDIDNDGIPELVGMEDVVSSNCFYIPTAIWKRGTEGYARDVALMRAYARTKGHYWEGPEPRTDESSPKVAGCVEWQRNASLPPDAMLARATQLARDDALPQAAALYQFLVRNPPKGANEAALYRTLGELESKLGHCQQARAAFERSLELKLPTAEAVAVRQALQTCIEPP